MVLDAQLIAVSLANGTVLTGPLVPDMAAQIADPVGLFLPDPQQFIHSTFPVGAAKGHDREFLCQVVAVHNAKLFNGMGRGAVSPVGADLKTFIGKAVIQNIQTSLSVKFVCSAQKKTPPFIKLK